MNETPTSTWKGSDLLIMIAGLATTALALFGVFLLAAAAKDFNLMGWYVLFIIPVGAILVGIAAGSGYGLASWFMSRKINGALLVLILVLLVAGYCAAQYVQFQSLQAKYPALQSLGFFEYYDVATKAMTFSLRHGRAGTGTLGAAGYLFRFLELAGFALGGLLIPLGLKSKEYCGRCGVYMRKKALWHLPAAVSTGPLDAGDGGSRAVLEAALLKDVSKFQSALAGAITAKEAGKLETRFDVRLDACPRCSEGVLTVFRLTGRGDKVKTENLGVQKVESGFVAAIGPTARKI